MEAVVRELGVAESVGGHFRLPFRFVAYNSTLPPLLRHRNPNSNILQTFFVSGSHRRVGLRIPAQPARIKNR